MLFRSDISGMPILEVYSNNNVLLGSTQAPALFTSTKVNITAGTNTIYGIPTSAYTGAYYDYNVLSATGARSGNVMAIWSGNTVNYSETTTTSIGSTSGIKVSMSVSNNNAILSVSANTGGWVFKTIVRSI